MTLYRSIIVLLLSSAVVVVANAEDTVILKDGGSRNGTIDKYRSTGLELTVTGGRTITIPINKIKSIRTAWTGEHLEGDRLFAQRDFTEAIAQYGRARKIETRQWVRRKLMAHRVDCFQILGKHDLAALEFLAMVESDPHTEYLAAIPLAWHSEQPTLDLLRLARPWNAGKDPVRALIGASWLLSTTSKRAEALQTLRLLETCDHREVALLATAQAWRVRVPSATPEEIAKWRSIAKRFPEPLRAGPYFLIGKALAQNHDSVASATILMRVPVHYPRQRSLVAECLFLAAGQLHKAGEKEEAARIDGELIRDFPKSPLSTTAKQRLQTTNPK